MESNRLRFRLGAVSIFTCVFVASTSNAQRVPDRGQIIATGWDNPSPSQFRQHLAEFEKWPFQGTVIRPVRKLAEGREVGCTEAFQRGEWTWPELEPSVADLKGARPSKAVSNYLMITANPGNVDFFDDAGWAEIASHWQLLARVARQGGLKGLLYDEEPYSPPHEAFGYSAQPEHGRHSFGEYAAKARERGRQVMSAVVEEYPDITIFAYRLLCDLLPALASDADPTPALETHAFGLVPGFVNGWLDVAPPTVKIIEGNENAYRYNSDADFDRAYVDLTTRTRRLISPENRAKFRSQVLVGHGIYLDAHANPPSSPWYIDPKGGPKAARLEANVASALRASDGYIWVYGETARWWPTGDAKFPIWPAKLSGADLALLRASDPIEAVQKHLATVGPDKNLAQNASFSDQSSNGLPAKWWSWQKEGSHGAFARDDELGASAKGAARVTGCSSGCFGQDVEVRPGRVYAIRSFVKKQGRGTSWIRARWRDDKGAWTAEALDMLMMPAGPVSADGWRAMTGMVRVPEGAYRLVVLLSVAGQGDEHDIAWFDDMTVARFDLEPGTRESH